MKRILTLITGFFCLFASTAMADIASPSFSPLVGFNNPAVVGFGEGGMEISAGSTSTSYTDITTSTTTNTSYTDYSFIARGDSLFGGLNGLDASGTSSNSYYLGYSMDTLQLALGSAGDGTNTTTTFGLSWNFGSDWYLGLTNSDNGTTSDSSFGIAYVSEGSWRLEYGNGIVWELLFGDYLFGWDGDFNGPASASSVYLGWQQEKGGFSVLVESLSNSELPATIDSGTRISVGMSF